MKEIAFVPDVHMESPDGDPYYRIPGTDQFTTLATRRERAEDGKIVELPNEPWLKRQLAFLLDRIVDPRFIEGLDAALGELERETVRGVLKRQAKTAGARSYLLEDDHARRLMNATMQRSTPHPQPQLAFNEAPFIRSVKDMTTPIKEIELPPVTNGAAAQA